MIRSETSSSATQAQVAEMKRTCPALKLDVAALANDVEREISAAVAWALPLLDKGPVLIYTSYNFV